MSAGVGRGLPYLVPIETPRDRLAYTIARRHDLGLRDLKTPARPKSKVTAARDEVIKALCDEQLISIDELGSYFGMTESGVDSALRRIGRRRTGGDA